MSLHKLTWAVFALTFFSAEASLLKKFRKSSMRCSMSLASQYSGQFDYVCDTTVPWFHSDGSSWAPATPPAGTGCHEYVFLTGEKPDCSVGEGCDACASPSGQKVFTVRLQGGSCTSC
eukprot:gnl/MRDRNA2_/MRDRNA2_107743_c0_seq1.p1 gnl/MRDRNA2_/MRDRNA2_107743_c0~~gnl/MRDRNA2_/MRDRNA2_107743_c0_seq1.p1  ORF type:complete len:118 (-),score=12.27 gnl/MRDRNA2_/MRDRNA2_107743_c0_seq1:53-406(-)